MINTLEVSSLEQAIQDAIAQARTACESTGNASANCAVAWDIVEELQAERAHRQVKSSKTSLEVYCDQNPDAAECRIYDV
ncbi:Calvin cycle protein CP12 [Trichocoleus sp. FACHB-591]|uniref:Calvin cycle protein CP12 n=1 Tax=Trichocoleus sp. FACHB-591 TaxID=2692872 RepID=UPI0016878C26|nr:Calvin cycle protein CP12 [Trichocoleus sp. FACHB-591]MBD2097377.1 Calvin cycle protein CP12 [Trichocoleus sp. FACHB-591]